MTLNWVVLCNEGIWCSSECLEGWCEWMHIVPEAGFWEWAVGVCSEAEMGISSLFSDIWFPALLLPSNSHSSPKTLLTDGNVDKNRSIHAILLTQNEGTVKCQIWKVWVVEIRYETGLTQHRRANCPRKFRDWAKFTFDKQQRLQSPANSYDSKARFWSWRLWGRLELRYLRVRQGGRSRTSESQGKWGRHHPFSDSGASSQRNVRGSWCLLAFSYTLARNEVDL